MQEHSEDLNLAVLIDADNAPRTKIMEMMAEVAIYGNPTIKRIYGDWTTPNLAGWKGALLEHAITPIQQYAYTTGKNSTDSAMIIDAMDILYSGRVQGFFIVSSDSDFTRLAVRLREAGMMVYGLGEKKTPSPFIAACNKFIYTEIIGVENRAAGAGESPEEHMSANSGKKSGAKHPSGKPPSPRASVSRVPPEIKKLILATMDDLADDDGWAFLGEVGSLLLKKRPDFDPRNFGFSKLTPLIKAIDGIEIDVRQTNFPHIKHIYIRSEEN